MAETESTVKLPAGIRFGLPLLRCQNAYWYPFWPTLKLPAGIRFGIPLALKKNNNVLSTFLHSLTFEVP